MGFFAKNFKKNGRKIGECKIFAQTGLMFVGYLKIFNHEAFNFNGSLRADSVQLYSRSKGLDGHRRDPG